jgi:alkanesulfonate monooxygenase SsuD/methylene tetrahydromethanopterin reductase-like flavin-dependent oxidoreductase (luciferase family)
MGVAGIALHDYGDIAQEAEKSGAYALCVGEAANESFASAAYFGAITSRPKIISAITTWVRPPVNTALAATTVDDITNSRFELGLGTMPDNWNRDFYGINPNRPLARMREYVEVVRQSWASINGKSTVFFGEFYQVDGYKRIAQAQRALIPIHLAATRPGMAKLAGEIADGVIVNWLHTEQWLRDTLEPAIQQGCTISGRQIQRSVMVRVLIEPNSKKARELLQPSFNLYRNVPYFHEITASAGFITTPTSKLSDELIDAMTVHGSLDHVVDQIHQRYGGWADWLEIIPPGGVSAGQLRGAYEGLFNLTRSLSQELT